MRSLILCTVFLSLLLIGCDEEKPVNPSPTVEKRLDEVLSTNPEFSNFKDILENYQSVPDHLPKGLTLLAPLNSYLTSPTGFDVEDYLIMDEIKLTELINGATFTSVNKRRLTVTVSNGKKQINGISIDENNVASAENIAVFGLTGIFQGGTNVPQPSNGVTYYISYYENGIYHSLKGLQVEPWIISNTTPLTRSGGCSAPDPNFYYGGTFIKYALPSTSANDFVMEISRTSMLDDPKVGTYNISNSTFDFIHGINNGNCNLSINSAKSMNPAAFVCDVGDKDASITIKVAEVKILKGSGISRTGYYSGTFEGILYRINRFGAVPEKVIINSGKFLLPIGQAAALGEAPDPPAGKIVGKWFLKKLVVYEPESYIEIVNDEEIAYVEFKANGEFTEYINSTFESGTYRIEGSKYFVNGETIASGSIKELTDTQLVLNRAGVDGDGVRINFDAFYEK